MSIQMYLQVQVFDLLRAMLVTAVAARSVVDKTFSARILAKS